MNAKPEILPSLRAHRLGRRYHGRTAVDDLDLCLHPGEVLGLLGLNGAGKSTAMRMLSGNLAPDTGQIEICGVDLSAHPLAAKTHLGYLPEIPPLYRELAVDDYLGFAARLHRVPGRDVAVAVAQAMQRCGLAEVSRRLIGSLSKGYQQRVGIAQAIIHGPDVIILDEPTAGLDPLQIREIRTLIAELGRACGVILSTHILAEAEALCDRVLILHHGRTVFSGSMAELRRDGDLEEVFVQLTRQDNPA